MKGKRDQITGAVLVILGIVVFLMTTTFSIPITSSYPGPRMLPDIAAFGFVVCGLGIFIESVVSKREETCYLKKEGWLKVGLVFLMIAGYIAGMMVAGYLITTPVILYILTTVFAKGSSSTIKGRIVFSLLTAVIIYLIYVLAFGLTLPSGLLFN
ncbi:tripartite tricarboxylate transporter TctB family protein [Clostridium sp. E02]|uniref:tripartite tricarboxylate transporter TctB family protein n=1 Tax=Clostridium sp. E02 TaxID=2487134 RepID=UPI000F548AE3|nr:tripartite tricarboxylate transporter TctB family protein [Clostridium sp. E02]